MLSRINVENEKVLLKNNIVSCEEILNLLNSIKFKTKKDGKDFQDLIKNIDMASIEDLVWNVYYFDNDKDYIVFSIKSKLNEAPRFWLDIKSYDIKNIDKSRLENPSYLAPYYYRNVKELKEFIEKKKIEYQEEINQCQAKLNIFDKAISEANAFFEEFNKKYNLVNELFNCIKK